MCGVEVRGSSQDDGSWNPNPTPWACIIPFPPDAPLLPQPNPTQVRGYGWVAWLHFNIRWEVIWLRNSKLPLRWLLCKFLQWVAAVRRADRDSCFSG